MGGCVSLYRSDDDEHCTYSISPMASVISVSGELRQYGVPITARQVLDSESSPCFICNSDGLLYEEFIPALNPNDELLPNQIYFILPKSKLQYRLSASDMAALAVRESLALQKDESRRGGSTGRSWKRGKKNSRSSKISPVLLVNNSSNNNYQTSRYGDDNITIGGSSEVKFKSFDYNRPAVDAAGTFARSGSVRKMQGLSSRRVKMAVRSFRMRLSTIHEGSVL